MKVLKHSLASKCSVPLVHACFAECTPSTYLQWRVFSFMLLVVTRLLLVNQWQRCQRVAATYRPVLIVSKDGIAPVAGSSNSTHSVEGLNSSTALLPYDSCMQCTALKVD